MNKKKQKLFKQALELVNKHYTHRGRIESIACTPPATKKSWHDDNVIVFFKGGFYIMMTKYRDDNEFRVWFKGRWKNARTGNFIVNDYCITDNSNREHSYFSLYKKGLKNI